MFTSDQILGNVDLRARDFHGEPFYDVLALTTDPRFRDSMRLITQYSLLPFSPSDLVMTSLLHFEEKVHRKGLARVEELPLLMSRLLSQVLEHLGFPEERRIERRISCTQVLSTERSLYMPISIILQQQDQEEVAEDPPRGEDPVPEMEVEVERSPVPHSSPPSPPPPPSATAPADVAGPSLTSQQSLEHIHVSSRELAAVMDAVCTLATT